VFSKSRREIIGFCDGDNYWYANKLELQLPLFARSSAVGVVYSAADGIDEHGKALAQTMFASHRGVVTKQLFMRNFVPFGTALVRRECLERVGAFDTSLKMGIDWDLWLRVSAHYQFDFVGQATYAYRIWSGQMSKNWRGRYFSAFRIMDKFVRANPGLISANLRRKAYADTFANRARARSHEQPLAAVGDGARAVLLDPLELYSWASLGRVITNAALPRSNAPAVVPRRERYRLLKRTLSGSARMLTSEHPRVLMYHHFSYEGRTRTMRAEEFRRQMLLLKDRCAVLPLAEVFACGDARGGEPLAAVTVDDGYADFFEIAFPILRDLGIRASAFVTRGFVDRQLFWWLDGFRAELENRRSQGFELSGTWQGQRITLRNAQEREAAWNQLADQLVFATTAARESAVTDLASALGVATRDLDMSSHEAMTWAQLREISGAGFEIGDHSFSHASLPTMSDEQILSEISASKAMLEDRLGIRVRSFAYPNGTRKDYDSRLIGLLRRLGYENAVLSIPAPVNPKRRFEIGRFSGECSIQEFGNIVDGFPILRQLARTRRFSG
jgi:peptidoglycan/xylan/chitin deacetylase (PgdA/CDA1 family)